MNFILRFRPNRSITLRGSLRRIVNDPSIHPSFRPSVFVESIKVYRREREKGGEGIIEIFIIRSPSSAIWNIGGPTRRRRSGRSEYIYILFVTIFLGSRPVRSDVSVYQIFEGRAEERDSFPGRRIAKPNSSPPPSASPSSSLVFPVCAARARSFSPPLSLGNWIVASNSARREPRGGSEFLCFFPLCLRPSPFVENFPFSLRILSLLLSSSIHLYSSSILVES